MKKITSAQLMSLLADATTLEQDGFGIKVAILKDGNFMKLFRRKRLISSSLWALPAKRFADNANALNQRGIRAPLIDELFSVPESKLSAVIYTPLPGETLRQRLRGLSDAQAEETVMRFGAFLGQLHERGVYFRSLHLGNVICLPDEGLALIDVSDMHLESSPLSAWKRRRNLQHILRYPEDIDWLSHTHKDAWIRGYAQTSGADNARRLEEGIALMSR
ncbi:polymerase [Pseudomonas oleovorans]|uniref:Polymerase n=1 Tax=Ectopseudomonas oleovorans TaxID=301 RepID=A0AA42QC09_ECTOL|nr:polymerase [Pseudomonas oleovorans]MBP8022144.1 toluene tolerance protein [Azonexus sp.]MDH1339711.1 polymerase [Pseudomonas oleovorans]MDH1491870.1 polymerase [Pseudomonas oleovorans]WGG21586.1 polymerase [Pseudomonas oleovorans]